MPAATFMVLLHTNKLAFDKNVIFATSASSEKKKQFFDKGKKLSVSKFNVFELLQRALDCTETAAHYNTLTHTRAQVEAYNGSPLRRRVHRQLHVRESGTAAHARATDNTVFSIIVSSLYTYTRTHTHTCMYV